MQDRRLKLPWREPTYCDFGPLIETTHAAVYEHQANLHRHLAATGREIDLLAGKRSRSAFLTQAAGKELMRLSPIKALECAAGAWKDKDHPELRQGTAKWVKKLRCEYDRRFEKVSTR